MQITRKMQLLKNLNVDNNDCTINKSMLINWLTSSDEEISVVELGQLIESKTNGQYFLVEKVEIPDIVDSD